MPAAPSPAASSLLTYEKPGETGTDKRNYSSGSEPRKRSTGELWMNMPRVLKSGERSVWPTQTVRPVRAHFAKSTEPLTYRWLADRPLTRHRPNMHARAYGSRELRVGLRQFRVILSRNANRSFRTQHLLKTILTV